MSSQCRHHPVTRMTASPWTHHRLLSLNNPPACPRHNGAEEKSIRDLKERLLQRWAKDKDGPLDLVTQIETWGA